MHRFTKEDANEFAEQRIERARELAELDDPTAELQKDLDQLDVDIDAIKALGCGDPVMCSGIHTGLMIAEYQRARTREAVTA